MQKTISYKWMRFAVLTLTAFVFSSHLHAQADSVIWKGDVKITFEKEATSKEEIRSAEPLELIIENSGLIMGKGGPACQIIGDVLAPPLPSALYISTKFSNCSDKRLNGNYSGTLKIRKDRQGTVFLSSIRTLKMEVVQISGDITH